MKKTKKTKTIKTKKVTKPIKEVKPVIVDVVDEPKVKKEKPALPAILYGKPVKKKFEKVENSNPVIIKKPTTPFEIAMNKVKILGAEMIKKSNEEAIYWRAKYGMDERGYPIKGFDIETGAMKIPQKRGRKPLAEKPNPVVKVEKPKTEKKEKVVKEKKVKAVKTKKTSKKKEKSSIKGRVAVAPILSFTTTDLESKRKMFDTALTNIFGDKYNVKKGILSTDGLSIKVERSLTKPTPKNPDGVFLVTFEADKKKAKFYEWDKRFWMSQLVNYSHYMKPVK